MKIEADKSKEVESIFANNWAKFDKWASLTNVHQIFAIPEPITDVLIPRRILELAQDPSAVHVLINEADGKALGFTVFEHQSKSLTDWKKLEEWYQRNKPPFLLPNSEEDSPEGVDYMHIRLSHKIATKQLTVNDKVYFQYSVDIPEGFPYVAQTRNYTDRAEMQGQGIGTSFYNRWEDVLRRLGFKYLTGHIISGHPDFFKKTRTLYEDLPDDIKSEVPAALFPSELNKYMIRTL